MLLGDLYKVDRCRLLIIFFKLINFLSEMSMLISTVKGMFIFDMLGTLNSTGE